MKYIADLHVHSKYSRATAKDLDLERLYLAARLKGITLVGTGDFTHPAWFAHLKETLIPAEPGLYKLRDDIESRLDHQVPASCGHPVRFILQTEISNIYKKDSRTRKNHNLIFMPDLDAAQRLNRRLDQIGNIKSDGRPILGLDARLLLEMLLDLCPQGFLVPAHIWTPWFSLLGSKSGFDSLEECFGDLAAEIFAVETGLSSDPPMNRRVSRLDRLTLISNSDAHSSANLGRNANIFQAELSFDGLKTALASGSQDSCQGTIDLYPEEGKYHFDGHRQCHVCLNPRETRRLHNLCPKCQKPLTLGVLYRVEELADRPPEPEFQTHPCHYIIPLAEILAELCQVGSKSQKVARHYQSALNRIGPELFLLLDCPETDLEQAGIPLLTEAVRRMRAGNVILSPGYDGEYGKITLFDPAERQRLLGASDLFEASALRPQPRRSALKTPSAARPISYRNPVLLKSPIAEPAIAETPTPDPDGDPLQGLNDRQRAAVLHGETPLLIIAGPGAGKTRTLTCRIARLIRQGLAQPAAILAVTFTNKAAQEMRERLAKMFASDAETPLIATFHGLCLAILKEEGLADDSVISEEERASLMAEVTALSQERIASPNAMADGISRAKQLLLGPEDDLSQIGQGEALSSFRDAYRLYQRRLERERRLDFDDLIFRVHQMFSTHPDLRQRYADRFKFVFVDEYQDLNHSQYLLVKSLAPDGRRLCVIGDPDQSIYGFRGADVKYFQSFTEDFPDSAVIRLERNYRSTETILEASHQVISRFSLHPQQQRIRSGIEGVKTLTILEQPSAAAEATAIGKTIEQLVGGVGFHSLDFQKITVAGAENDLAFSDIAILFRTAEQGRFIAAQLQSAGLPCQLVRRDALYSRQPVAGLLSWLKLAEGCGAIIDLEQAVAAAGFEISPSMMRSFKDDYYSHQLPLILSLKAFYQVTVADAAVRRRFRELSTRIEQVRGETENFSVAEKLRYLQRELPIAAKTDDALEAMNTLIQQAERSDPAVKPFLNRLSLQTDPDVYDQAAQKIALMTLHAAKGLEFPVVFIAGCEQGLIPFSLAHQRQPTDEAEERRLFYVAMTRAKSRLILTRAKQRLKFGKIIQTELSPYVQEIQAELLSREHPSHKPKATQPERLQLSLFGE